MFWCHCWEFHYLPTPMNWGDFFLFLFMEWKLSPSSTEGYRSTYLMWNVCGWSLMGLFYVDQLLKSFCVDRPHSLVVFPKWDLSLVLHALTAPLLQYSCHRLKVCRLHLAQCHFRVLALVCQRWYLLWKAKPGMCWSLFRPLGSIMTQPLELAPSPVTTLKAYEAYSSMKVPDHEQFFVSLHRGGNPVVKSTISSWVIKLIRRVYNDSNRKQHCRQLDSVSTRHVHWLHLWQFRLCSL